MLSLLLDVEADRQYYPVFPLKSWNDDIDYRLLSGLAEMVTVESPAYPEVTEGVLFKEGFVTIKEMDSKLSEMKLESEHNMAVMEFRMDYRMNRLRDLDSAEISYIQEQRIQDRAQMNLMRADMQQMRADMLQQRAQDRAQISYMLQQRALDRAQMRAEMRTEMRAFTADFHQVFRRQ